MIFVRTLLLQTTTSVCLHPNPFGVHNNMFSLCSQEFDEIFLVHPETGGDKRWTHSA